MTEYWKSNPMYWCQICKVWLQDNVTARSNHERGRRHKENLAKKLRDMRKTADDQITERERVDATLKTIEAKAQAQYEADLKEQATIQAPRPQTPLANQSSAQESQPSTSQHGTWEDDPDSGYHYHSVYRHYYDPKSGWYYGGDPPQWTQQPNIPEACRFGGTCQSCWQLGQAGGTGAGDALGTGRSASADPAQLYEERTVKVVVPSHPLAQLGGHGMPSGGKVGAAKNLVAVEPKASKKREREEELEEDGLDQEELEARRKRAAARARVEQRTLANFGLG
ncbi:unnamed protein product [Ostreobium quekettii]|uniref:Matrin-type domain-containing protein n=1 Tax=Ostreobium quekettii TaxID=121088 RepID=A0A8S1J958_9CHLO|nr:unnamed protein product [Ostreobium quekettii]|eukprot:evm.model.scf_564EXC.4 EVM.evm.TU.scf_564EXC.4   scf_564EXC:14802-17125(-)